METYAVHLRPRGSHIGPITAQTIFGGVCWALTTLQLGGDLANMLAGFHTQPRFLFSSTFPFIEGEDGAKIHFFPKPALAPLTHRQIHGLAVARGGETAGTRYVEAIKAVMADTAGPSQSAGYVSAPLFAEICRGEKDSLTLAQELDDRVEQVGNLLWLKRERQQAWSRTAPNADQLWYGTDVQRNAIDRVAGATAEGLLFHEYQTFYRPERAGLWFLARADAEAWSWLQAAFRYLGDTGLGGKRTVGKGHFDFSWEPAGALLPVVENPDSFITFSPYFPRFENEALEAAPRSYRLLPVRQVIERKFPSAVGTSASQRIPIYSGGIRLFAEGSVFVWPAAKARPEHYGQLARLWPREGQPLQEDDHPIYYNGLALPVFARLGGVG